MTYIRNEKKKEPDLTDEELDALANLGHTEESGNSRDLDEIEEKEEIEYVEKEDIIKYSDGIDGDLSQLKIKDFLEEQQRKNIKVEQIKEAEFTETPRVEESDLNEPDPIIEPWLESNWNDFRKGGNYVEEKQISKIDGKIEV